MAFARKKKDLNKGKQTTWREVLCVVWTRRLVHSDKHSEVREKPLSFRLYPVLARWQPKGDSQKREGVNWEVT